MLGRHLAELQIRGLSSGGHRHPVTAGRHLCLPAVRAAAITSLLLAMALPALAAADPETLLQLTDYVSVDYPNAVAGGAVVSASEYAEMREFGGRIRSLARELEPSGVVVEAADRLAVLIDAKAQGDQVAAAARAVRTRVLAGHPVVLTPPARPDLAHAAVLYEGMCASCHGATGGGDGPLAQRLDPPPINFKDHDRASQRSLYGLYNTITLGVEGTAMASFGQLPDAERWALAFYVGGFTVSAEDLATGEALLARGGGTPPFDMRALTSSTPREIAEHFGPDAGALALHLRRNPAAIFASRPSALDVARARTELAVDRFRAGDRAAASAAALSAYLDGFELVESGLSAVDPTLARRVEADMLAMRATLVDGGAALPDVEKRAAVVLSGLDEAQRLLAGTTLTPGVAFSSALIILFREGLEAILVLAAIAAFMGKTGRGDALRYMHAGWIAALALGAVTWVVSTWLLAISGATRELTEGLTALFAAVVLFYAGFWMHSKLNVQRWNEYLRRHIGKALDSGTLWTLALVSFIAVYREVFETVLFYQALWAQTGHAGQAMILGGAGAAALLLVLAAWGLFKLGVRLPLRQFFGASAVLMIALALVFAGKGVAALQEAGRLPSSGIPFLPRIDLLGIYPSWQGVAVQLVMIAVAIGLVVHNNRASAEHA